MTICLTRRHKGKFGPKNHKKPQGTLKNPNNTMESSGTRREASIIKIQIRLHLLSNLNS